MNINIKLEIGKYLEKYKGRKILDVGNSFGVGRTLEKTKINVQTLDIDPKTNPVYVADAQCFVDRLKLNEKFDFIYSIGTLEHIIEPKKMVDECYRALKKGGESFHWVPFIYRVHASYGDYWRFTPDSLRYLFKDYKSIEITPTGGVFSILTRMFYLSTAPLKDLGFAIRVITYPLWWLFCQLDKVLKQDIFCRGYLIKAKK